MTDGPVARDGESRPVKGPVDGSADDGPATDEALDFWSFVDRASHRLQHEHGYRDPLATRLILTLNRSSALVTYDLESSVHRPRGRSWAAFRIMFVLWLAGPLESKRAAELTGMSRAGVSNLTSPLVSAGVLDRSRDPHDGRSVRLSLTEAGRAEIVELFAAHNARELTWASALDVEEQQTLIGLLEKLISSAGEDVRHRS